MKEHKEVRSISPELKAEALRLVREEFRTPASVAKELGVSKQSLSEWMKKEREEDARGRSAVALSDNERLELSRLRREVAKLRTEKDILKKAAAHSTGRCISRHAPFNMRGDRHGAAPQARVDGEATH